MDNIVSKTLILNKGDAAQKREEIRRYFHATYDLDEQIYTALKDEGTFYLRADPLRHPLIFYIGHTAVFYINKLILAKVISQRINPGFESMFAVGVDEMSWDDLNESNYNWPPLQEVLAYRQQVRELIDELISELPLQTPINWESPFWVIMMGIEHQRIHIETSSVLIRQLPLELLQDYKIGTVCKESGKPPENELIAVEGKLVKLGKTEEHALYGWDNEYGKHEYQVDDFTAGRYLVSNHEYKQFVDAGGYKESRWWTEEGWSWKTYSKASYPKFWSKKEGKWFLRLVTKEIELPWNWPVEINYLEAKAFCNWKAEQSGLSVRLPTEDEWYILYNNEVKEDQPWWDIAPGNINLEHFCSPCPIDKYKFGEFYDVIGNVWQWTETAISGYEGFRVHPCYDDFSTPTFDGRHNMIKGGSWISTGNEATKDSRYAFRRHFFQHAGFRYVVSKQQVKEFTEQYETDPEILPQCELDYGEDPLQMGNFAQRLVNKCIPLIKQNNVALNIGCGVGRAAFELAEYFDKVVGIDFTARLIKVAEKMKSQKKIKYLLPEEGEINGFKEVTLESLGLAHYADKVEFWQADASNLGAKFTGYDFILAENILEKLYDPVNFLQVIYDRLNDGGILVISSTYNWQEGITAADRQLGGFRKDGEPVYSIEGLREALKGRFKELQDTEDLPLLIRKNRRNYQYQIAEVSYWQKQ